MEENHILPLGSIVKLKPISTKIIIIGRGTVYTQNISKEEKFADYVGVPYPTGFDPNSTTFFNNEDIETIYFTGYSDQDEIDYLGIYSQWKQGLSIPK